MSLAKARPILLALQWRLWEQGLYDGDLYALHSDLDMLADDDPPYSHQLAESRATLKRKVKAGTASRQELQAFDVVVADLRKRFAEATVEQAQRIDRDGVAAAEQQLQVERAEPVARNAFLRLRMDDPPAAVVGSAPSVVATAPASRARAPRSRRGATPQHGSASSPSRPRPADDLDRPLAGQRPLRRTLAPTDLQQMQQAVQAVLLDARAQLDERAFRVFVDFLCRVAAAEAARCVNWEQLHPDGEDIE